MRKALLTAGLALGVIGVTAGAAAADPVDPVISDNTHHTLQRAGLVGVSAQDVLTNTNVTAAKDVHVLDSGVNVDAHDLRAVHHHH